MPFIVNPELSVMTFGYEKCRCEFTMQSVQEITKLSITKVFPLKTLCKDSHNVFTRLGGDGSHQEAAATRRTLQQCVARISSHGRRRVLTIFTSGKSAAGRIFSQISGVLERISAASQLKVEERWQLLIYYAFRKYQLVHRMYPPLVDDQIMLKI